MPGGNRCSVAICKSHSTQAKSSGEPLIFFSFPKDLKIRKRWIEKCRRKDKWNPATGRMCSLHFNYDDYEDRLVAELMNTKPRKLKSTAVPSLNLSPIKSHVPKAKERPTKFLKAKKREEIIQHILKESEKSEKIPDIVEETENNNTDNVRLLEERISTLSAENKNLNEKVKLYEHKLNLMEDKARKQKQTVDSLLHRLNRTKKPDFHEEVKRAFKGILTPNQIDIMLKKKTKARWTHEEFNNAYTLHYLSQGCYTFLRNELHYPVPGPSTLRKWAANLELPIEISDDISTEDESV